jgi:hypothetical protein
MVAGLPGAVRAAGIGAPLVVVVGNVASLHDELAWFEASDVGATPLGEAASSVDALEKKGATS